MTTLARSRTSASYPASVTRLLQQAGQLEASFVALLGSGVVSGARVVDNGGLSVYVESTGTEFFHEGVLLTLASDQVFNGIFDDATTTVWGRVLRTAANPNNPADSDTYSLELDSTDDDSSPGTGFFRLAYVPAASGDIITVIDAADGKRVPVAQEWRTNKDAIAAGESLYVPSGEHALLLGPISVAGTLAVAGRVAIL